MFYATGPYAYLTGREVVVHGSGVCGIHEQLGNVQALLDGGQLQTQEVAVNSLTIHSLKDSSVLFIQEKETQLLLQVNLDMTDHCTTDFCI